MENERIIFIDSNIWIYFFDQRTPEHPYIKDYLDEIYEESTFAVNVIVITEVIHYLVKQLGVPIAKDKWEIFSSMDFYCGDLNFEDLNSVFTELCNYTHIGIGGRDASIIAFLKENGLKKICTHDKAFKQIVDFEVIDPIPEDIKVKE